MLPSLSLSRILAKCRFRRVFLRQMSLSKGSAIFCFLFWIYFSCGFSAVAFSLNFSIYVVGSPLACPLGRLGPLPHPLVSLVSSNHATPLNLVQTPWNFVEEFGIAGNPNKGHSVSSQLDQTEPRYCRRIPSIFASLSHGLYSRSRARVALGSELQLPMSFPWSVFPGLDQDLFPLMVFLVFWDSIPKRCKGVHCVDLGESFPTSIYLQKSASIQPRRALQIVKFEFIPTLAT